MPHPRLGSCTISVLLLMAISCPSPLAAELEVMENDLRLIGGLGGLYLLAEPGELSVSVYKRDRHEGNRATDLRAILLGPDRMVLDEVIIQGNDQATLTTQVESRGVYVVNVTAAYDRYGDNVWWGFSTTSSKYLVETSRGHKDARHVEPITLGPSLAEDESDLSYDICFLPSERGFTIELEGLSGDEPPSLFDSQMRLQGTLDVAAEGTATLTVPPTDHEPGEPWCLHLPDGASQILIDGVTQWEQGDRLDNLSLWSPNRASFFPLHDLRWALTPYAHVFHAESDTAYEVDFRLHNNGSDTDTLRLTVESDALQVSLSEESITVAPGEAASITARAIRSVNATVGETAVARLIVTSARHPEFETWSRLEARSEPVTSTPVELPLVYRPYEHENAQFGYTPDYPNDNQMYFGPDNTAWIRANDGLHRYTSHQWDLIDTIPGKRVRASGSKIAFGNKGEVCLLAASTDGPAYLYSADAGKTFSEAFTDAPKSRTQADIEQFAGHNLPAGPAPFVVATQTGGPDPANFWRRVNDLNLYLPEFDAGSLTVGEPIPVSQQAIGISSHSGIPSAIASAGDRVHVIWGEATDPDVDMPGVPAFVATWDRSENRWLGAPSLVGYGPPANDVHNTPSLVIDSEGYLHTLTGTHGSPFAYARSLAPHTAHEGFTEPVLVEEGLRSTYVGLVCGPDDTLHLVFRAWKDDGLYHPHSHYANLGYKRKTKDGEWEPMQRLAVAPFSEYSIWYHRLTIDRRGRLFVSFDIWSTFWFYRTDHVGQRRKTIMSPDGGDTWQLLQSSDLGD